MADYPVLNGAGETIISAANSGRKPKSRILAMSAVAISHTGNTAETTLATVKVPARSLGKNGAVRISQVWSMPNNANNKSARTRFGGTLVFSAIVTTSTSYTDTGRVVQNRGAENAQIVRPLALSAGGTATSALVTAAVDTTQDVDITFTAQCAVGTDTMTLESYTVEIVTPDV